MTGVRAVIAFPLALALSGCAIAPEFKTFHLSAQDWRGTDLSGHGQVTITDAVAGAAPLTITRIEIGGILGQPFDPERRMHFQDERAKTAVAALERHGIAPFAIGVESDAVEGFEREPPEPLIEERFVVGVHY